MRLLVIGSSSSAGTGLPDQSLAWPWIVERELPALIGQPVELRHQIVFPVGSKAVPIAQAAIDAADADVIVHSFGFFPAIIATVSERVRRRYGARAHRIYRRAFERYEGQTARTDGKPARVNGAGRWLARRIIGAQAITTRADLMANLVQIQRLIVQREGALAIAMCEPTISDAIARDHPQARRLFGECKRELEAVSRAHHITIADCATPWAAYPHQNELFLSDGLHKSAIGQRIQADVILATIVASGAFAAPAGYASVIPGTG